jgi:hypothetical protein
MVINFRKETNYGYPFNAGQLEDGHRDLKCRKAHPQRLRIQKPEALCYRVSRLKGIPQIIRHVRIRRCIQLGCGSLNFLIEEMDVNEASDIVRGRKIAMQFRLKG